MRAPLSWFRRALWVLLFATAVPGRAAANGRFPSASYFVVGPGPESRVMSLRSTFGLVSSYDGGHTWGWVCEEALNAVGMFDASLAIGFDGTLVVGSPDGLVVTHSGCSWGSPRGDPMRAVVDVASDDTGRYLVTAVGPTGVDDALVISADGGATWTGGARLFEFFTETVEMAPSRPSRIYVSGFVRGGIPVIRRSDDGGMTTTEVARDTAFRSGTDQGTSSFIGGVDPTNPDVVYVRSAFGFGTLLLRSDDAAVTFHEVARTDDQMVGFALSDDGSTVWIASANRAEGIRRSVRGGPFTRVMATVSPRCLRQHGGVLYVCADEVADGFLLGSSADGGDHIDALMSARLLMGVAPMCGPSTQVGMVCGPLWSAVRTTLTSIDAGAPPLLVTHDAMVIDLGGGPVADAVVDALADAPDAAPDALDATTPEVIDAIDVTAPDAPADTPGEEVAIDAPGVDVLAVDVSVIDAPVTDVALDGSDATVTADRGGGGMTKGCSCGAGAPVARGSWGLLAAMAVALGRRRRRSG